MTESTCPQCGAQASGKFCSNCAAPLTSVPCGACGAPLTPGAKFCHVCGTTTSGGTRSEGRNPTPWIAAGIMAVIAIAAVGYAVGRASGSGAGTPTAAAPGGTGQVTTDLSSMTPRQQADRLFDRVMIAHEQGDAQQVAFFAPMAVQAYEILGGLDADARYHVGLISAISGEVDAALAQADSLEAEYPGHLMAAMLRNGVAQATGDPAAVTSSYRNFLEHFDAETAAGRSEYQAHSTALNSFRDEAQQALGESGG